MGEPKYRRGILSLSGDPITFGHLDIIRRAGAECAELVVAILHNPDKRGSYVFTADDRRAYAEKVIAEFCPGNAVRVIASDENLSDMFLREDCDVVFRGARDAHDRAYEELQLTYHEMVFPGIRARTVILDADPALRHVQSTVARSFAEQHLDATGLVPMFIQARLWRAIHEQKVIGVTGCSGVGKSYLITAACDFLRGEGTPAHHVDLGALLRELCDDDAPGARALRDRLAAHPGGPLPDDLRSLQLLHLSRRYRRELRRRKGIVLVEYTYLVEDGLCHWTNNNVVVIKRAGHIPDDAVIRTTGPVWDAERQFAEAKAVAARDRFGNVFAFENVHDFAQGFGGVIAAKATTKWSL